MDNFEKYCQMKDQGASPRAVYLAAKADSLDVIARFRLIRKLFALSLREAKEVYGAVEFLSSPQTEELESALDHLDSIAAPDSQKSDRDAV